MHRPLYDIHYVNFQMLRLVVPKIWIELHEAVNSGNIEKTTCIIERLKNQDSLKQELSNSAIKQDIVREMRTHCNPSESNSEFDQQANIEKDTMSCEKIENDSTEYSCVEDVINQRFESYHETLLHLASRLGQADVVKILLEAGANPTLK